MMFSSDSFFLGGLLAILFNGVSCQYHVLQTAGCAFPFTYQGKRHTSCFVDPLAKDKKAYPWYSFCSETPEFKGVWKYCHDQTKTNWRCTTDWEILPNEDYPSCTSDTGKKMFNLVGCPEPYKKFNNPKHTACLPPSPNCVKRTKSCITDADKRNIVHLHNEWRRMLHSPGQPNAANMQKMYWDDDLAIVAENWAKRCSFSHDDPEFRKLSKAGTGLPGQNIVMVVGTKQYNFTELFHNMYVREEKLWKYGTGIKHDASGHALHLTQILVDHVSRIGCGCSECAYVDRIEKFFVCNYNHMQMSHETVTPYKAGHPCSMCRGRCDNKLCDCEGMECLNGGVLNVTDCTCECAGLWEGQYCDKPIVPELDDRGCMIPCLKDDKLHWDCMDDDDGYGPYCCTVPEFDGENIQYDCQRRDHPRGHHRKHHYRETIHSQ